MVVTRSSNNFIVFEHTSLILKNWNKHRSEWNENANGKENDYLQDTLDNRYADQDNGASHDVRRVLAMKEGINGLHHTEKLKKKIRYAAWISNHMHFIMWDEITYPFPNFNGGTVEVWEWISDFIPHYTWFLITYPCWDIWRVLVVDERLYLPHDEKMKMTRGGDVISVMSRYINIMAPQPSPCNLFEDLTPVYFI